MIYLFDDKNSKAKQTIRASEKKAKANANTHEQTKHVLCQKKSFEFGSECRYTSSVFIVSAEGIKKFRALKTD